MNSLLTTKEIAKKLVSNISKYNFKRFLSNIKEPSDTNRLRLINSVLSSNFNKEYDNANNYKLLLTTNYRKLVERLANYKEHGVIEASSSPIKVLRNSYSDIFKVFIPHEFNGIGTSFSNLAFLLENLRANLSVSYSLIVNNLLCAQTIIKYGSEIVKSKYLPRISSGESIGSFLLNESNCGNHICMMTSTGEYSPESKLLKLSARKYWIYNADSMDFCIIFVKTKPTNGTDSLSAFLIDNPLNYSINIQQSKNNLNISNVFNVEFEYVSVSAELLGNIGDGFRIANDIQNSARFSVAAACLGISKAAMEELSTKNDFSSSHTNNKIVEWSSKLFGVETGLYFTANVSDNHPHSDLGIENASLKIHAVELAYEIIHGCIEISKKYDNVDFYLNLLTKLRGLDFFLGQSDVLRLYVGGVILREFCQENSETIYKTIHKYERKLSEENYYNLFPPTFKKSWLKSQIKVLNSLMGTMRSCIFQAAADSLFNTPNQDFFIARVAKAMVLTFHISCVINRYKHMSKEELTDEDIQIIEACLNDLRKRIGSTIREGSDTIYSLYNNTKYEAMSEVIFRNQVHGIEPALTRNY